MKKQEWKGSTLLAPVPCVMVSVGTAEKYNIITIGWTGILNSQPPKTYISVRPERFSYGLLRENPEFVINLTPDALAKDADFCGMYTGAKVDKFQKTGLTPEWTEGFSAPAIAECPVSLLCKVTDTVDLGTHTMFVADIVKVLVSEELLDGKGKLRLEKAHLCAYVHGDYVSLGKKIGSFGFSAVKKKRATPTGTKEKR